MNLALLIRDGLVLETREAVALIHEVCRQAGTAQTRPVTFPQADDLWITRTGSLSIVQARPASAVIDPRAGAAALLDDLLPATGDLPGFVVHASLRSLPARLRASVRHAPAADPHDLLAIFQRHLAADPHRVLQRLFARATGEATGRRSSTASDHRSADIPALIPLRTAADALDLFDAEPDGSIARGERSVPAVWAPAEPARTGYPRLRPGRGVAEAAAAALVLMAALGYAGRTYVREDRSSPVVDGGQSSVTLSQPASSAPESALPDRPLQAAFALPLIPPPGRKLEPIQEQRESTSIVSAPSAAPQPVQPTPNRTGSIQSRIDTPHPLMLALGDGAFSPSFDPSGRSLLFHSGRKRTGRLLETVLDERGGSASPPVSVLSGAGEAANNYHPRISPDGRLIAFDSDRDGERGVYVSDRHGLHASRVSGSGFAAVPSWSPDMKWLAFFRAEPSHPRVWNLWVRDLAAGTVTRYTSFRAGQVWNASWFPDSRRLCYTHEDQLVILDTVSGTSDRFRTPRPGRLVRTPAVSPDGKRVLFQVFRDGVWMLDLESRSMRKVLDDPTAEEFTWDPAGKRIAYHSRQDGQWRIWMATLPTS